jgi:hypothetical protein
MNGNSLGVVLPPGGLAAAERSGGSPPGEPQRSAAAAKAGADPVPASRPDPEVVAKPKRRTYTAEYKHSFQRLHIFQRQRESPPWHPPVLDCFPWGLGAVCMSDTIPAAAGFCPRTGVKMSAPRTKVTNRSKRKGVMFVTFFIFSCLPIVSVSDAASVG